MPQDPLTQAASGYTPPAVTRRRFSSSEVAPFLSLRDRYAAATESLRLRSQIAEEEIALRNQRLGLLLNRQGLRDAQARYEEDRTRFQNQQEDRQRGIAALEQEEAAKAAAADAAAGFRVFDPEDDNAVEDITDYMLRNPSYLSDENFVTAAREVLSEARAARSARAAAAKEARTEQKTLRETRRTERKEARSKQERDQEALLEARLKDIDDAIDTERQNLDTATDTDAVELRIAELQTERANLRALRDEALLTDKPIEGLGRRLSATTPRDALEEAKQVEAERRQRNIEKARALAKLPSGRPGGTMGGLLQASGGR